ncbi:MAG: hypothetical protein HUJ54_06140 [Erysipelotrichaceae bacterium]|nr:hypothetical protein [Erysipelotrichaceae bacterium]
MTELVKVKDASYSRYEELLILRDQYEKEADSILIAYTQVFGDLTADLFEAKIECIRLKKTIAGCQKFLNRGSQIDLAAVEVQVDQAMSLYEDQLDQMLYYNEQARKAVTVSDADARRVKTMYCRLAKKLHPDMNPETAGDPELSDLWNRIVIAYKESDFREMTELEVLANRAFELHGLDSAEVEIPDLEAKIESLEKEINTILTTEPYTYMAILEDPFKIGEAQAQMKENLQEAKEYAQSLQKMLGQILEKGGVHPWQMN